MKPNIDLRLAFIALFGAAAGTAYLLSALSASDTSYSHLEPRQIGGAPLGPPAFIAASTHLDNLHRDLSPVDRSPAEVGDKGSRVAEMDDLERLRISNSFINAADRVINSGKRADFEKLEKLGLGLDLRNDYRLEEAFELQILRVDRFFFGRRGHRSFPINVSDYFPEKEIEDDLTVGELVQLLIDPEAPRETRIRAADLLGQLPPGSQPRLPGFLLHAAGTDPDLEVIDEALLSFGKLTGTYPNRMFDTIPASVWWQYNQPENGVSSAPETDSE